MNNSNPKTVTMPEEEANQLRELQTMQELKRKIILWAGSWFAILSLVVTIIGFFGVRSTIKSITGEEISEIKKTVTEVSLNAAADAKTAAIDATNAAKKASDEAMRVTKAFDKIKSKAETLDTTLTALNQKIEDSSQRAAAEVKVDISSLQKQVNKIITKFDKLGGPFEEGPSLITEQKAIKRETNEIKKAFSENSEYQIFIITCAETTSRYSYLPDMFRSIGFRIVNWRFSIDAANAAKQLNINLDSNIDPNIHTILAKESARAKAEEINAHILNLLRSEKPRIIDDYYNPRRLPGISKGQDLEKIIGVVLLT